MAATTRLMFGGLWWESQQGRHRALFCCLQCHVARARRHRDGFVVGGGWFVAGEGQ